MRNVFLFFGFVLFILYPINLFAAKVTCSFDSGEAYDLSSGAWLGQASWDDIWDIFGEGLELDLDNDLLDKLDSQEIFWAGKTDDGDVYLAGSEYGVYGRLSYINDQVIIIYSGFCEVGFG